MIPVVIHHVASCPLYLKHCIEINAQKNKVYLIGDSKNNVFGSNIVHVDIGTLESREAAVFKKYFKNYSTNDAYREYLCFERFFILREFMTKHGFDKIAYVDSDCVLLENISEVAATLPCALSMQTRVDNPMHMVSCIHNSILTVEFCNVFIRLCKDIYINQSKLHLIHEKRNWHAKTGSAGGVCDMTLCYLITRDKMIDGLVDTNEPMEYLGETCVFDHHIGIPYGFEGENTYVMDNMNTKQLMKSGGKYYARTHSGKTVRLLSMHFSGGKKRILESIDPKTFFDV
jgi:hypothetical protein